MVISSNTYATAISRALVMPFRLKFDLSLADVGDALGRLSLREFVWRVLCPKARTGNNPY